MILDGWVNLPDALGAEDDDRFEFDAVADFFGNSHYDVDQSADHMLELFDASGIDGGLLFADLPFRHDGMGVLMCSLAKAQGILERTDRFRLVVNVPGVRDAGAIRRLVRELADDGTTLGVGVGGATLGIELTDRRLYTIYAAMEECGLALVANVGIFGPPRASKYQHPMLLEEICADFPDLTVIAAHMGHPWEQLLVRLMMKFPKLHLMTSAYAPKYIDPAVIKFMSSSRGAGRVLWASDYPVLTPQRCLTEARALGLPADVLDGYLGDNLAKALGW